uniref:Intraflagellar transport protein 43 homolog n=1 Tax=Eptatretus burgeri TaxID=7764 RepID=A0A8C4QMP0_EPTBU
MVLLCKPTADQNLSSRPSCRQNVWADDRQQLKLRKKGTSQDLEDDHHLKPLTTSELDDDDIPVIPDLEDIQKEDLAGQTADPPRIINMLPTYEELNTNLGIHAALQTLDGDIDLSVLARALCSQENLLEEDVRWDQDRLFMEVSSELKMEREKVGKPTKGKQES